MTMIAIKTTPDRAEIMTDSLQYTEDGMNIWIGEHARKAQLVPGHQAMTVGQGAVAFTDLWRSRLDVLAADVADFDELAAGVPDLAREAWQEITDRFAAANVEHGGSRQCGDSIIFLVGYSLSAQRFRSVGFASLFNFEPVDLDGFYVMPTPLWTRPGPFERHDLQADWHAIAGNTTLAATLDQAQPPPVPDSIDEWIALARQIRETRALAPPSSGLKVLVGGQVNHQVLTVDSHTHKTIHEFTDEGKELLQLVAGTLNPAAQDGPCTCGSGVRLIDCHLADVGDKPCPCSSGRPFGECCSINAPIHTAIQLSRRLARV